VSVIDGARNAITAIIPVGSYPTGVGVNPNTDTMYVPNEGSYDVSVFTSTTPDTDLAISTPANVTVDATGPSGATVNYTLPTVTDEDGTTLAPTCTPASGTVFSIGTTTVNCSVTDTDDIPATVSSSFTVIVKGAAAQLADLYQTVQGMGPGTSLADKVALAQSYLAAGDVPDTCGTLGAFVQEVQAQTGHSVPPTTASTLITDAQRIEAVLSC